MRESCPNEGSRRLLRRAAAQVSPAKFFQSSRPVIAFDFPLLTEPSHLQAKGGSICSNLKSGDVWAKFPAGVQSVQHEESILRVDLALSVDSF
jgi:hypothetical protein